MLVWLERTPNVTRKEIVENVGPRIQGRRHQWNGDGDWSPF
jgi:hypothetical protein